MSRSPNFNCPLCGQYMTFISTTYRNQPFIDGKCYRKMCFCCAHVPQDYVTTYKKDGSILEQEGPLFDHKHLWEPEDLLSIGAASNPLEAQRSVRAVKMKLREVGAVALRKLKLRRPDAGYEINPEWQAEQKKIWAKERGEKDPLKRKRVSGKNKTNAA